MMTRVKFTGLCGFFFPFFIIKLSSTNNQLHLIVLLRLSFFQCSRDQNVLALLNTRFSIQNLVLAK
jgi:hypothetical protein